MSAEEFLKVIEIITEDYKKSDVEDLKKIRDILNEQIESIEPKEEKETIDERNMTARNL